MPRRRQSRSPLEPLVDRAIELVCATAYGAFRGWWDSRNSADSNVIHAESAFRPHFNKSAKPPRERKPRSKPLWWKVLEVTENASWDEITKSYRLLMSQTHPDKVQHLSKKLQNAAEREAKRINSAYEQARNVKESNHHE